MIKAGQEDVGRRQKLRSMMEEMLSAIHNTDPCLGHRRTSEFVEDLLRLEGTSSNLLSDSEAHINAMEDGECLVIVAGNDCVLMLARLYLLFQSYCCIT